jgi:Flp pilus assembly pilin Flp
MIGKLLKDEGAVAALEYGILAAAISLAVLAALPLFEAAFMRIVTVIATFLNGG